MLVADMRAVQQQLLYGDIHFVFHTKQSDHHILVMILQLTVFHRHLDVQVDQLHPLGG